MMSDNDSTITIIEELQTRLVFQEDAIETLSLRVVDQDKEIQKLHLQIQHLNKKINNLTEAGDSGIDGAITPPPHY